MLVKFCNVYGTLEKVVSREKLIVPFQPEEFRYFHFRAIGNMEVDGQNGNADGFPYQHFEDETPGYGYRSFINKRAHLEHRSDMGIQASIGDLPDASLESFVYPVGWTVHRFSDLSPTQRLQVLYPRLSPDLRQVVAVEDPGLKSQRDGSIHVLMRVDMQLLQRASRDPRSPLYRDAGVVTRLIDTNQILPCSMGTNVEYSHCTVCGNEARFPTEYCSDLKYRKGGAAGVPANAIRNLLDADRLRVEWLPHLMSVKDFTEVLQGSSNKPVLTKIAEMNHRVSFFELSIVGKPAYPKGWQIEKIASIISIGEPVYN